MDKTHNYKRVILLVLSDKHAGSTLGLTNPETQLLNEHGDVRFPHLNEIQTYLWELYIKIKEKTEEIANGDDIVILDLGDNTQGLKYSTELATTKLADHLRIASYNMYPLLDMKNVKVLRFCTGTGWHVFGEGSTEDILCELLRSKYPNIDIKTLIHGKLTLEGVITDYAHHGPATGIRNWLQGNVAYLYTKSLMMYEMDAGNKPPDLVLRGHRHIYVRIMCILQRGKVEHETMFVSLPSLCFPDDYAVKVTQSVPSVTNGAVAFEIINGKIYKVHRYLNTVDIRTKEEIRLDG
jgi:hypothetical protein